MILLLVIVMLVAAGLLLRARMADDIDNYTLGAGLLLTLGVIYLALTGDY